MKWLFVTGMTRSGTTLVDKLLNGHHQLRVLSQPLTPLYKLVKERFFNQINYQKTYYVLNNLFQETKYDWRQFSSALTRFEFSVEDLEEWDKRCPADKRGFFRVPENFPACTLSDLYRHLLTGAIGVSGTLKFGGSKEVNCEEFIGYFADQGVKCICVLRDPRSVISSLNTEKGTKFAGTHRPTLFHIRNWRKSVAFTLLHQSNANFLGIRYEDLVLNPLETLDGIAEFLEVEPFPGEIASSVILDQEGQPWVSNSSWEINEPIIHTQSLQRYCELLSPQMIKYIEATSFPEMLRLNYKISSSVEELIGYDLESFREQFILESDLKDDYSFCQENIEAERTRIRLLMGGEPIRDIEAKSFYIDMAIYHQLSAAIRTH